MRRPAKLGIALLVVMVVLITVSACSSEKPQEGKGKPKLSSQLNQLVRAEMRGEAVSFARQNNIELIDNDSVRVIIECVPGKMKAVKEAAISTNATVETGHDDLLQAVVPIKSLTTLADAASIRFIRLPYRPLPEGFNEPS